MGLKTLLFKRKEWFFFLFLSGMSRGQDLMWNGTEFMLKGVFWRKKRRCLFMVYFWNLHSHMSTVIYLSEPPDLLKHRKAYWMGLKKQMWTWIEGKKIIHRRETDYRDNILKAAVNVVNTNEIKFITALLYFQCVCMETFFTKEIWFLICSVGIIDSVLSKKYNLLFELILGKRKIIIKIIIKYTLISYIVMQYSDVLEGEQLK